MLKVLSLFSGIGAFEKALDNLEVEYELVGYCEIDKYASRSYAAIHDVSEEMNLWDVTKIETSKLPEDIDLITYGFPCQDISLAGKQKGLFNADGSKTRSGLFFEALRIIEDTKPKIAIAENVKNLTSKKFSEQFKIVLDSLEEAGYNNYWKILNSKDYGIPQNRERVFIVSIRKDIDHGIFEFPKPFPLEKRLKDILEDEVDEKYYLSDKAIQGRLKTNFGQYKLEKNIVNDKDVHPTILARYEGAPTLLKVEKEPTIISHNVTQTVKVRKFEVDINALQECLHKHKNVSCKKIAWELDVPVSQIEHYFRKDKYFAIPDADIWLKLKALLHIETDEFDEAIMTFEEKEGEYEKANRVYDSEGISATLTRSDADMKVLVREATKVVVNNNPKIEVVGNYSPSGHDASRIISSEGIAPTVKENHGTVTAIVEPTTKHRRVAKTSGKRR